ncbi:MAG: hypothetical protein OXQ29_11565 [Rhodospirillaceae bacterium]|nr:hypothetical protein [Rhodospirillaceae bacterium]
MSGDAAEWLKARSTCTLWTAFQDIGDNIESCVAAANNMGLEREKLHPYSLEKSAGVKQRLVVRGFPFDTSEPEDAITVEIVLNKDNITVSYPRSRPGRDLRKMVVTQRWNA